VFNLEELPNTPAASTALVAPVCCYQILLLLLGAGSCRKGAATSVTQKIRLLTRQISKHAVVMMVAANHTDTEEEEGVTRATQE
jgi:hypothetical protein